MSTEMKTRVYVFCNTKCHGRGDWHSILAMGEDGVCCAGHICSSHGFINHDMGFTSTWKHDAYDRVYGEGGWELVLTTADSPEVDAAYALNQESAKAKEATTWARRAKRVE